MSQHSAGGLDRPTRFAYRTEYRGRSEVNDADSSIYMLPSRAIFVSYLPSKRYVLSRIACSRRTTGLMCRRELKLWISRGSSKAGLLSLYTEGRYINTGKKNREERDL